MLAAALMRLLRGWAQAWLWTGRSFAVEEPGMLREAVVTLFGGGSLDASAAADRRAATRHSRAWLTERIVRRGIERPAIVAIKAIHTAIFAVLMGCVVAVSFAAGRDRMTRRTTLALVAIVGEGLILSQNQGRCPLTDLVEDLGSEHGSVSDIFLPGWVARHIPHISCAILGAGLSALGLRRLVGTLAGRNG